MLGLTWLRGLVARRPGRLAGTAAGVAVAVALLASIGLFLSASKASMTQRAVTRVPVDWQVEAQPGADPATVLSTTKATSALRPTGWCGYGAVGPLMRGPDGARPKSSQPGDAH